MQDVSGGVRPTVGVGGIRARELALIAVGAVATGVALAFWPVEPRPLMALVTAAGAWLSIRHVHLAAAGLAFVIVGNLAGVVAQLGLPSPSIALGAAIVLGILLREDRWTFLPPMRLVGLFGTYGLVVMASVFWAGDPLRSLQTANGLTRDMILAALVAVVVRRTGTLRLTLWAIVAATTLLATVSSVQYLTGAFTQDYLGLSQAVLANIVGGTEDWRIAGTIGDPNHYAQTLLIGLPIALNRGLEERTLGLRVAGLVSAAVTAFAVYTTFSRGGALVLIAVVAIMVVRRRPGPLAVVSALMAFVVVIAALPTDFRERILAAADIGQLTTEGGGPQDVAVRGRLSEVLAGTAMVREEPLLGVGAGNYPARYQEYAQRFQLDRRPVERSAHSLYVEIAAETGVVGLSVFLVLLVVAGVRLRAYARLTRLHGRREDRGLPEALAMSTFAFLATSVLLHAAHARGFWLLLALILCLPAAADVQDAPAFSRTRHLAGRAPTG